MKKMKRQISMNTTSFNEKDMTVELVYSAGALVDRGDYREDLIVSEDAIDDTRLSQGSVNLIWNHDWEQPKVVGRIVDYSVENGEAVAVAKLSSSQYSAGTLQDIKDGVLKTVSVGYEIIDSEMIDKPDDGGKPILKVLRWMPFEISLVGIPADPKAQIRSLDGVKKNKELVDKSRNESLNAQKKGRLRMSEENKDEKRDVVTDAVLEKADTASDKIQSAIDKIEDAFEVLEELFDEADDADEVDVEVRKKAERIVRMSKRALDAETADKQINEIVADALDALEALKADLEDSADELETVKDEKLTDAAIAERARAVEITSLCKRHGIPDVKMNKMIKDGVSVKGARDMVKIYKAGNVETRSVSNARIVRDEAETRQKALTEALYSRMSNKPVTGAAREYRNLSFIEIARIQAGAEGRAMNTSQLYKGLTRSFGPHTSYDMGFNSALQGAIELRIKDQYKTADRVWEPLVNRTTVRDFRPNQVISNANFPRLKKIPEGAEIEFGTAVGENGTFVIAKHGRGIAFTFEAFVNDNIRYIDAIINSYARSLNRLEDDLVFSELADDKLLGDGKPVFDASRGNIISQALDVTGLAAAQLALRKQVDVDGTPLNLSGNTLIVGPNNEMPANRLITPIVATDANGVNPFTRMLQNVIVDNRIKGDDWYLTAGKDGDLIEIAYLDGYDGVNVEEEWDPKISATAYYAKTYVGANITGWRGFVKSVGADGVDQN